MKEKESHHEAKDGLLYNKYYSGGSSNSGCYYHPKEVVIGVCHLCLNDRLLILAAAASSSSSSVVNVNKNKKQSSSLNNNNNNNNNNQTFTTNKNQKQSNLLFPCSNEKCCTKSTNYINVSLLPNIFALFTHTKTTQHRRNHRHRKRNSDYHLDQDSSTCTSSLEDESFISIKFGDNGIASWDKKSSGTTTTTTTTLSKIASVKNNVTCSNNSSSRRTVVVEHAKPRPLRWRKRIGQLLQLIRWKKFSKVSGTGTGTAGGNSKVDKVKSMRSDNGWIRPLKTRSSSRPRP